MDESKIERIKNAVKANFNDSPDHYDAFERRYGLFAQLTRLLAGPMAIGAKARILDVGCGTGASTIELAKMFGDARIWGLDLSAAMLDAARQNAGDSDRIRFVEGDAGNLAAAFSQPFDAILYTACIFLVPDVDASLAQAKALLSAQGAVGCSFMDAVYDARGQNALAVADQRLDLGLSAKRPVALESFMAIFANRFDTVATWHLDIAAAKPFVRDFFTVPAMSAGLFPGLPYPQRVDRVQRLVAGLEDEPLVFRWHFSVGR